MVFGFGRKKKKKTDRIPPNLPKKVREYLKSIREEYGANSPVFKDAVRVEKYRYTVKNGKIREIPKWLWDGLTGEERSYLVECSRIYGPDSKKFRKALGRALEGYEERSWDFYQNYP